MVVSLNKGKELEAGVAAIENLIIEHTPAFNKSRIKFIRNKILTCKGVKHEIDLYVEINPGSDYKSLFIFECKNRKKSIGKEPVLSFISKISDLNAQCGFFIAKSYTKSAKALASRNTRVKLLRFNDTIDVSAIPPVVIEYIGKEKQIHGDFYFQRKFQVPPRLNIETATIKYDDQDYLAKKLLERLSKMTIEDKQNSIRKSLRTGLHEIKVQREFKYRNLSFKKNIIKNIILKVEFNVMVKELVVESEYNVDKRGRVYNYEKFDTQDGIDFKLSWVTANLTN